MMTFDSDSIYVFMYLIFLEYLSPAALGGT